MITDHGEAEADTEIIGSGGIEVCFAYLLSLLSQPYFRPCLRWLAGFIEGGDAGWKGTQK
jgi:hypothetical protein